MSSPNGSPAGGVDPDRSLHYEISEGGRFRAAGSRTLFDAPRGGPRFTVSRDAHGFRR